MNSIKSFFLIGILFIIALCGVNSATTIDEGHQGVLVSFGGEAYETIGPGFHMIDPRSSVKSYDCRLQSIEINDVNVKGQDQQGVVTDFTVSYNINPNSVIELYREVGSAEKAWDTVRRNIRSVFRERSKSVESAADFFDNSTPARLQTEYISSSADYATTYGIQVTAINIRNQELPDVIKKAIDRKVEAQQRAEQQKAELARYKVEQEQLAVQATARLEAAAKDAEALVVTATAEAESRLLLATAEAEAIRLQADALKGNPDLIRLRATEAWDGKLPDMMMGGGDIPFLMTMPVPDGK